RFWLRTSGRTDRAAAAVGALRGAHAGDGPGYGQVCRPHVSRFSGDAARRRPAGAERQPGDSGAAVCAPRAGAWKLATTDRARAGVSDRADRRVGVESAGASGAEGATRRSAAVWRRAASGRSNGARRVWRADAAV